ncbi:MAG: 50S ribosomal protein L1 [Bradymonadaceae bacterium]
MTRRGKRYEDAAEKVDREREYDISEAVSLLKEVSFADFDESADVAFKLNVNPRQASEMVRGSLVLPHGTGADTDVLVFARGDKAEEAEEAGADIVGDEDLVERIQEEGFLDFDVAVATPDMMGEVGKIGRILGPRGLMPNPKSGTVTFDLEQIVEELKAGRLEYRVEKAGIIHVPFGRVRFDADELEENLTALGEELARQRPAGAKLPYFQTINISSTMSPGIKVDPAFARDFIVT